jgi:hypothetical protein
MPARRWRPARPILTPSNILEAMAAPEWWRQWFARGGTSRGLSGHRGITGSYLPKQFEPRAASLQVQLDPTIREWRVSSRLAVP